MATEWPSTTSLHCWNCAHSFETVPLPLPLKYDPKTRVFYVTGVFCTWGCAKKYNIDRDSVSKYQSTTLLSLLRHRVIGMSAGGAGDNEYGIVAAPSRARLKCFGGSMTIAEFRSGLQALLAIGSDVKIAAGDIPHSDKNGRVASSVNDMWDLGVSRTLRCVQTCDYVEPTMVLAQHTDIVPCVGPGPLAESIVNAPSVRNQPYKLKRSKPVGNVQNTLFQSMKVRVERHEK
jgi:hypothetical protein